LRTNLKFSTQGSTGRGKIIAFTSAGIGEGKTITASNFALASAQSGIKTLLVEVDLRRPNIHRVFGLPRDPGITGCLMGIKKWQEVARGTTDFVMSELAMDKILHSPGIENLKIITSGPVPPNPVDLFNSPGTAKMLAEMAQQFELVILDCPPVLLFADTLIVGMHTTGVIIVYQVGKMARGALKRAKNQLMNVKAPVLGVVLNDLTASEMEPSYGYYYSYKYYAHRDGSETSS
ncbi:MAG: CpsD/CapB family tyrosine-protein kinase, partial [Endomicrobiales bacterium]